MKKAGLTDYLDQLGFNLVGYGCTTCIGNSGPLPDDVAAKRRRARLIVAAVLSGNRNFEGRIHPQVRANYLASPPLVVAYALAGRMDIDLTTEPLGNGSGRRGRFPQGLWPSNAEIEAVMTASITEQMFRARYADVFSGDGTGKTWRPAASATPGIPRSIREDVRRTSTACRSSRRRCRYHAARARWRCSAIR